MDADKFREKIMQGIDRSPLGSDIKESVKERLEEKLQGDEARDILVLDEQNMRNAWSETMHFVTPILDDYNLSPQTYIDTLNIIYVNLFEED